MFCGKLNPSCLSPRQKAEREDERTKLFRQSIILRKIDEKHNFNFFMNDDDEKTDEKAFCRVQGLEAQDLDFRCGFRSSILHL